MSTHNIHFYGELEKIIPQLSPQYSSLTISLRLKSVWTATHSDQFSFSAWRNFASLVIQNAPSEDSDQTAWIIRLIWIFAELAYLKVHFLTLQLNYSWSSSQLSSCQELWIKGTHKEIIKFTIFYYTIHSIKNVLNDIWLAFTHS